jgi:hypothetical protein
MHNNSRKVHSVFAGKIDSHNVARFCAENATERK